MDIRCVIIHLGDSLFFLKMMAEGGDYRTFLCVPMTLRSKRFILWFVITKLLYFMFFFFSFSFIDGEFNHKMSWLGFARATTTVRKRNNNPIFAFLQSNKNGVRVVENKHWEFHLANGAWYELKTKGFGHTKAIRKGNNFLFSYCRIFVFFFYDRKF